MKGIGLILIKKNILLNITNFIIFISSIFKTTNLLIDIIYNSSVNKLVVFFYSNTIFQRDNHFLLDGYLFFY